jgi:PAS domain S-box-containing protein
MSRMGRKSSLLINLGRWFSSAKNRGQLITRIASSIVVLVGCLVLVGGWGMNVTVLKSIISGAATMKANTALCFILAGVSLALQTRKRRSYGVAKGLALAVLSIGALTLAQYLFGWNLGIDELLFRDVGISPATKYPGRMGDNTALNFALAGLALCFLGQRTRRSDRLVQTATLLAAAIALLALVGYAYNVQVFYQFFFYSTSMALLTALTFLVLCVGVLSIRADRGLMQTLTSNLTGGIVARKLIAIAIAIPSIVGWLILRGLRANLYNAAFSFALLIISLIFTLILVIWINARWLNRIDGDRKRSSDRLRSSEERLQLALRGSGQGTWDWDLRTQILTWDDRCKEIFGLSPDFPVSYQWHLEALHPDDRQRVFDAAIIVLRDRTEFNEEYRTFHPDGTMCWVLARGRGYYNAAGEPERISGTVMDISDRKQAETDLQERNEHIQLLYETTRDLLSTSHPLTLIDKLFAKLKPLIGLDIYFNYIIDEEQQKLHLMFSGGISDETARSIEWLDIGQAICGTVAQQRCQIVQPNLQQSKDPKTELVRSLGLTAYSCQPLIAQGKLFGTLGFGSRTRTEFTPAETKLFQAICDRIAIALERSQLVSSLQQQTEELKRVNRLKDEFLAALSHELRTPLNPILGWTQLLQAQKLTVAKTTEALATIERNVKQQIVLIDDLLDVSRIIQGKFNLTVQPVDLAAIVKAAIETVHFAAIAKSITLEFHEVRGSPVVSRWGLSDTPSSSISIMGDETRLQQIFWNILSNAIKFTADNGRVDVWLEQVQNYNQIRITDTGIGIAPEFLPHVFDPFRQADGSSTRRYGGLGLGGAIVKHLVELHGGTVEVESLGQGQGATFRVKLPMLKEQTALSDCASLTGFSNLQPDRLLKPSQFDSSSSLPFPSLTGIRVLVTDDEPDNLDLLDFILTQEGAIVTAVTTAREALAIVSQNPPDILISDIGMPEMDGYELLQQIRALHSQQNQRIPAIALTAFARSEDEERAIEAGFQAYLSKPLNPIELIAAIAKQVNPSRVFKNN